MLDGITMFSEASAGSLLLNADFLFALKIVSAVTLVLAIACALIFFAELFKLVKICLNTPVEKANDEHAEIREG